MKACIILQGQYSKMGHAIARNLKERYGIEQFCAYIYGPGAKDFVLSQKDITYNPILVDHELHADYKDERIDLQYIRKFEQDYGNPNLWRYFYCDRKMMMSMGPKEESTVIINPFYQNHDDFLKIFQAHAKPIEAMLKTEHPDFIFFFAISALGQLILYHVAKKLGIKTYNLDSTRVANRISISEDYNTLTAVEKTAREFSTGLKDSQYHKDARQFIDHFRKTGSLNLEYFAVGMAQMPKKYELFRTTNIAKTFKYLFTLSGNYLRNRKFFLHGSADMNPVRFIMYKIKQRYRAARGIKDLCSPANWSEPFVYFPLHYEPELAILLLSPFYFDQISVIRYIARSVPLDYKVYIKEHPAMKGKRPRKFYKELLKLPNVRLIDPNIKSIEILTHAKLVATITGTTGWEASLLGIPVITFGNVFYNALSFVKRVRVLEELPSLITEQINHFAYKEEELINFTAAVFKESVPFDFSSLWYENNIEKLTRDAGLISFSDLLMKRISETR